MANKDLDNEEYIFEEPDADMHEPLGDDSNYKAREEKPSNPFHSPELKRKLATLGATIVGLFILVFGIKYCIPTKKQETTPMVQVAPSPMVVNKPIAEVPPPIPVESGLSKAVTDELKQKVSTIETNLQSATGQVNAVNQQLGTVNTNVNNLNDQITKLNQVITELSAQVSRQSDEIRTLMVKNKPKPVRIRAIHKNPPLVYYIQAVIPGRAWLIASNGSTLSIREGTRIRDYGIAKIIDPIQGRVLTSSGRVITFSQDDS